MSYNKSPLKWAGSKNKALKHLLPIINKFGFDTFVEPFIGAANVSLNVDANRYIWNDLNTDVINTHRLLISYGISVNIYINKCRNLFGYGHDVYYKVRENFNNNIGDLAFPEISNAAQFQYLNKHGFNGLCRYNKKGEFNVPIGTISKNIKTVPEEQIWFLRNRHKGNTKIYNQDFGFIFEQVDYFEDNCLIYCDPPYVSLTSDFKYTKDGFDLEAQTKLKNCAKNSKHTTLISNHLTEWTRELYSDADELYVFDVQRTISCDGGGRKKVQELVAVYYKSEEQLVLL